MFPVEVFQSTLSKWTAILRQLGIRFHLTGGITSAAWGEPRMTQDIDIVVDPAQVKLNVDALVRSLGESDFLFDEDSVRKAVAAGDLFQLLDRRESLKLDIYPREMIPGELDRSESLELFAGEMLPVASRMDAAASKLVWISKGSHKSRRDLRAIFRAGDGGERQAIQTWAETSGFGPLLAEVLAESDELE